jgi:hypothetical protein
MEDWMEGWPVWIELVDMDMISTLRMCDDIDVLYSSKHLSGV